MNKTETKNWTPAEEAKSAMSGFLSEFNSFQTEIKSRVKEQEDRLMMLDRKTAQHSRPALSQAAELDAPHQKAFNAYLRNGDDDALRGLELEGKALNIAVNAEGGYLVDGQTADRIQSVLVNAASIRAIANVVSVEATSFDVLIDHADFGYGWATLSF